jgi:hypothetical protein
MSQGPEAKFWKSVRASLPNKAFATRIENKHGGGVPDVHVVWDGLPFWLELKVTKKYAVNVSPHQIAWHMAYHARGGLSFFLVRGPSPKDIYLFGGEKGVDLLEKGVLCDPGARFMDLESCFAALRPRLIDHYRSASL